MTQQTTAATGQSLPEQLVGNNTPDNFAFQLLWTLARWAVGALMIHNGIDKLGDVQGFADNVVAFMGLPFPIILTYLAAYTEIFASILLMLGFFTRLNAVALLGTMAVAIFFHLKADGLQVGPLETASLYATFYSAFLVGGSGLWSIDALIASKFKG
ncbi:MAG: DoxX family protein [Cyanobacteria bacterium P01_H01_bin.15]